MMGALRIGIDIGGTFTDFVVFDPQAGKLVTFKLLSTPQNPAGAVLQGLQTVYESLHTAQSDPSHAPSSTPCALTIIHGSTVATNALLERKGARAALITTRGFRDLLEIGRQARPALYDLFADSPPPLVPADLRLEVEERVDAGGQILTPLVPDRLESLISALDSLHPESVAVCLLFSFLRPQHERLIGDRLRQAGWNVSLSSEILPEFREYERLSTTVVNAYVSPILDRYLGSLAEQLPAKTRLRVMQSNGGQIGLEEARRYGVRCILSGPAGGIIGALRMADLALPSKVGERLRILTFDMGGTSTDVSLIDGKPQVTTESEVGGCPIHIPVLDIHTIGAGGGSIAGVDPGGALFVGPLSAGADPGPACYARGDPANDLPTVTDANLVLGRLSPEHFLGGKMPLDKSRAIQVFVRLGQKLGISPQEAALGVIEVVNTHMERALRLISVERGYDPSGNQGENAFTLLSFGGSGGLHAADLARRMGIPRVVIPPMASTLSAYGMLAAQIIKDYSQTVMLPGDSSPSVLYSLLAPLIDRGQQELFSEGISPAELFLELSLDMRYSGQSYELNVPIPDLAGGGTDLENFAGLFHPVHQQAYGYSRPEAPVEIVNVRARVIGKVEPPAIPADPLDSRDPSHAQIDLRPVIFKNTAETSNEESSQIIDTPFYQSELLRPGNQVIGPAVIVRSDTTILLDEGDRAVLDPYHNLVMTIQPLYH